MDYGKLIKKSFALVWNNRFLWILGIFAGGSGLGFMNFGGYSGGGSDWEDVKEGIPSDTAQSALESNPFGHVLGAQTDSISAVATAILIVLVLALALLLVYICITSKGALVLATRELNDDKATNFSSSWAMGRKYFWRRLGMSLLISLVIFVVLIILSIPVILLAIFELTIPAIILGILFLIPFCLAIFYFSLFFPYTERIFFIENKSVLLSLKDGFVFFNKNWLVAILVYLISGGIGIGVGLAIFIALGIVGLILFGICALIFLASQMAAYIVGAVFALILLIALIYFSGAINSFNWTMITLAYAELKDPQAKG